MDGGSGSGGVPVPEPELDVGGRRTGKRGKNGGRRMFLKKNKKFEGGD